MGAAGEQPGLGDEFGDPWAPGEGDGAANWGVTIALAGVVLLVVIVGVVALVDGAPSSVVSRSAVELDTDRADEPPVADPDPTDPTTTTTTTTSSTTAPATTAPPTTTTAPPDTAPPTTVPPTAVPPTATVTVPGPDGWVTVTSERSRFSADMPGMPTFATPQVAGPSGPVERTEYSSTTSDGATISVSSVRVPLDGRPVATVLDGAAAQVQRDLGGTATVVGSADVAGAPSRQFHVAVPGGRVRAVVLHRADVLYTVSMFDHRSGPWGRPTGGAADAEFDRVVASLRLG